MHKVWTDEELREWARQEIERRTKPRNVGVQLAGSVSFLLRAMTTADLRATLNLGALTRFQLLLDKWGTGRHRKARLTKLDRIKLGDIERMQPTELVRMAMPEIPAAAATLVYRIAVAAGMRLTAVQSALILYGLEHLSDEIRRSRQAPTPINPSLECRSSGVPSAPVPGIAPASSPAAAPTTSRATFPSHEHR